MAGKRRWTGTFAAILAGGAVGVFLAPIVTPALARMMRPATKAALKAGMAVYQRGAQTAAELRETVEDVAAEINAEAQEAVATPSPATTARAATGPAAQVPEPQAAVH